VTILRRKKVGSSLLPSLLPSPRLYELIKDAERLTDINVYRYPTSVQRHFENLPAFPDGFLILGDAVASFNPFYGQGMSSQRCKSRRCNDCWPSG